jgi:aryl carrier-like protein
LDIIGRADHQVKIRGFRIELGEIEAALRECDGVRDAVVMAREGDAGEKRLVGYVVGGGSAAPTITKLRAHLQRRLPEYMIPAAWVFLDRLPVTPNGKLDRKALPAVDAETYARRGYEPPVGEIEIKLARIWADLLKVERVGRWDNFFELGGHSLLAVSMIERMRREGLQTDVRTLFTAPTLATLVSAMTDVGDIVQVPSTNIPNLEKKVRI